MTTPMKRLQNEAREAAAQSAPPAGVLHGTQTEPVPTPIFGYARIENQRRGIGYVLGFQHRIIDVAFHVYSSVSEKMVIISIVTLRTLERSWMAACSARRPLIRTSRLLHKPSPFWERLTVSGIWRNTPGSVA
jgi:hypothetical protein